MTQHLKDYYLKRLYYANFKIIAFTLILYLGFVYNLYQYYQNKYHVAKSDIIEESYQKIALITENKIKDLLLTFPSGPETKATKISINNHILELCGQHSCVNYNLFRLCSLLDYSIPQYIYYKISLNDHFIHSSNKVEDYIIDKIYRKDNLRLDIQLGIDSIYLCNLEESITSPFWEIISFLTPLLSLLLIMYSFTIYIHNKSSFFHIRVEKEYELRRVTSHYKDLLEKSEQVLLTKIWDMEYCIREDAAMNYLFIREASKIASLYNSENQGANLSLINNIYSNEYSDNNIYSIITLLPGSNEKISVAKIKEDFEKRFFREQEKLHIKANAHLNYIHFTSRTFLYQVIYSITSYLFFMSKEYDASKKHEIILSIDGLSNKFILRWRFDRKLIAKNFSLLTPSSAFFKSHANPFILSAQSISSILKSHGYNLNLNNSYDECTIDITPSTNGIKSHADQNDSQLVGNIIPFSKRKK